MKNKLLIFFFLFSASSYYSQTWKKISEYNLTGSINSLQFDSEGTFYAASNNGLFSSTNGGKTWNKLYPTFGFNNFVSNVLPLSRNEILISVSGRVPILKSKDGGLTWAGDSSYIGIDFLVADRDTNIYAGWEPIYKSTDKGKSWMLLKDSLHTWSFYVTSSNTLLAGTTCGIYLSVDNGNNWLRTGSFNCGDITAIQGVNDDNIIFLGGADRFHGIQYSTNGGYDWTYVHNSDSIRIASSIVHINNNEIYFGSELNGVFKYNIANSTLVSRNHGLTYGVSALAMDSLGNLYAASDGIYILENIIVSANVTQNNISSYSLEQNYPNPFNPSTTIKYGLEKSGQVYIEIFNLLGEKVAEVLNQYQSKGEYHVDFNANNLSSGIYIYKIRAGKFAKIKKMILLR